MINRIFEQISVRTLKIIDKQIKTLFKFHNDFKFIVIDPNKNICFKKIKSFQRRMNELLDTLIFTNKTCFEQKAVEVII
jgi:hypothetical protein